MQNKRRLHIGGECRVLGWENLNILPNDNVDHVRNAMDLSNFEDNSFSEIYASYVLNHFGILDSQKALVEWRRVLIPGGELHLSVPNIDILLQLTLDTGKLDYNDRLHAMQMIYGRQSNEYDYHPIGFNIEILVHFLNIAGYAKQHIINNFSLIDDNSKFELAGTPISLNLTAVKPQIL